MWPIYHGTTCVPYPLYPSEARDLHQKLICKGPVKSSGTKRRSRGTGNITWSRAGVEKWGEFCGSCSPWSTLSLQTFTAAPPTGAWGCSWTTEGSWLIYYLAFRIKLVDMQTGFETENQLSWLRCLKTTSFSWLMDPVVSMKYRGKILRLFPDATGSTRPQQDKLCFGLSLRSELNATRVK